jgi:signal peptidase II
MNRDTLLKYAQVVLIVIVAVALDQWTKQIASDRLASQRPGFFSHNIILEVPPEFDDKPMRDYIAHEFGENNTEQELADIARGVITDAGVMIFPDQALEAGQTIEVKHREIVVVEGYWDHQYTRNMGAAFSFLADSDSPLRTPFFIGVSILAVLMILWILRGVERDQQLLIVGLALVCGGAIGNLIDRVSYGYVIDFIVWKYTDEHRWPTFNLADAFICIGVAAMGVEMIRDWRRELAEKAAEKSGESA